MGKIEQEEMKKLISDMEQTKREVSIGAKHFAEELKNGLGESMMQELNNKSENIKKTSKIKRFFNKLNHVLG